MMISSYEMPLKNSQRKDNISSVKILNDLLLELEEIKANIRHTNADSIALMNFCINNIEKNILFGKEMM